MLSEIEKYINTYKTNNLNGLYNKLIKKYPDNLLEVKFVLYDKFKYQHTKK